jgi:hypothetical protein
VTEHHHNVYALVDAGVITATGTALAAVLAAITKLVQVLRERRQPSCAHEGCTPGEAPATAG